MTAEDKAKLVALGEQRLAQAKGDLEQHLANANAARGGIQMAEIVLGDVKALNVDEPKPKRKRSA